MDDCCFTGDGLKVYKDHLEKCVHKRTDKGCVDRSKANTKFVIAIYCENENTNLQEDLWQTLEGQLTDCTKSPEALDIHVGHTEKDLVEHI